MRHFFDQQCNARSNFLARLFGIFSEEIVRIWANDERAPYCDIGRPSIRASNSKRLTLDFTLQDRITGRNYIAEQKCEISFERFKYLTLTDPWQLNHHKKEAFGAFLAHARMPEGATIRSKPIETHGAILIWGDATPEGVEGVMSAYGLHTVLTISTILSELRQWQPPAWQNLVRDVQTWTGELGQWLEKGGD